MKSYTINYRNAIGSFLDWKEIKWIPSENLDVVTIQLKDDEQFASLIEEYTEWIETI